MDTILVTTPDGQRLHVPRYTPAGVLLAHTPEAREGRLVGALVNHEAVSLDTGVPYDANIQPLTLEHSDGWRMYERSVSLLLAKAVRERAPRAHFSIDYAVGSGLFCSFRESPDASPGIRESLLADIEEQMRRDVAADTPIATRPMAYMQALALFQEQGAQDTVELLASHHAPAVRVAFCGAYAAFPQGPLLPSAGHLRFFRLIPYPPGFVLQLPDPDHPRHEPPPFEEMPHLFRIFEEHKQWGRILGLNTVGRLNALTLAGGAGEFIKIAEALHERKTAAIADAIARRGTRVVLVAGPSSAGKTTFSKRLAIQLRVCGLRPHILEMDNYFKGNRQAIPSGPDGNPDFEHIEALDLDLLDQHLNELLAGRPVHPPRFHFPTKTRRFADAPLQLVNGDVLIIEGIHGLNPRLLPMVPESAKFRIYISALTQLSFDAVNRISTTDNRLLRRLVRDARFRGHSALETLRMWPSVRRGEKRWIFPFQRRADETFNSALDYELAVLKPLAEPLLRQVKPSEPEYSVARRLAGFLDHFLPMSSHEVPPTSILREYIGESSFTY
jgi:uridine kinase